MYIHDEQINQMWLIGIVEYHSAMVRNGISTQGSTWLSDIPLYQSATFDLSVHHGCTYLQCVFFGYWSSPVESFRHVWLFTTPWTAACQASLFIINSQSLFILMSVELVMSSNHLPLASPSPPNFRLSQLFPEFYPVSQFFASDGQSIGVSISKLVFPTNIQEWVPLGWTARIPLQSKGLLRVSSNTFSNTNYLQVKNIYSSACSFLYSPHLISIHLALSTPWTLVYICLCVNMHPHCPWVYN